MPAPPAGVRPGDPSGARPSSVLILLNPESGGGTATQLSQTLLGLAARAGVQARVELLVDPAAVPAVVSSALAAGTTTIVAGGGDGTIGSVASCLVGRDARLGVIPLGTLNHFAKDLGIPLDPDAAMSVVLAGHVTRVDVGEVNGRVFLNNSSIGLYPRMVRLRERAGRRGWRKWWAAGRAMVTVVRHRHDLAVRLTVADTIVTGLTPLVFVGNNEYRMAGLDPGARASLSDGTLALYILRARSLGEMVRTAGRLAIGGVESAELLEEFRAPEATIELRHPRIEVALDGEVTPMRTPLRYRVRPRALQVLVPPS